MHNEPWRISGGQIRWLCIILVAVYSYYGQTSFIPFAPHDSWIAYGLAACLGITASWCWSGLSRRFPRHTLPQMAAELLPGGGLVVGVAYAWYFLLPAAATARQVAEAYNMVFMPETPMAVLAIMLIILAISAARHGAEVFIRLGVLAFIGLLLVFPFFVPLAMAREMHPSFLLPVLYRGPLPVMRGALAAYGLIGDAVVVTSLYPFLNRPAEAASVTRSGILVGAGMSLVWLLPTLMVLGPEEAARQTIAGPILVRSLRVAESLERIEAIFGMTWLVAQFVRLTVFLWAATYSVAQSLGLRDHRSLLWPVGALVTVFTFTIGRDAQDYRTALRAAGPAAVLFGVALPAILWLLAVVRGRGAGATADRVGVRGSRV